MANDCDRRLQPAIAGYYLGFDAPSSIRTSLALRQGIWRKGHPHWQICGVPDILYTDNGADFTSKHLQQVAADLKIRLVFSIPGRRHFTKGNFMYANESTALKAIAYLALS